MRRTIKVKATGWALCLVVVLSVMVLSQVVPQAQGAEKVKQSDNLVEVTVSGAGMNKDQAVRDAMRKAVEEGAGQFMYSRSETRDFVLVKDTVLQRAAGFIQSHEILNANELEDDTWEVSLNAVVSINGIEDTWGVVTTLLKERGRPKIMVFIDETIDRKSQDSSRVQTSIENQLLNSGFQLVDREQIKAIDAKDLAAAMAEDSPARLQAIAKRFGAQLFISGKANAVLSEQKKVSGIPIFAYQSDANIKCYRADTAQLLSSIPGQPTRCADRAARSAAVRSLEMLANDIAPRVRRDILQFWQDALAGRGEVQLHVEGLSFAQYVKVKKALAEVSIVKEISANFHNKVAECSIQSQANAETLAEAVMMEIPEIEITDVSQNVIKGTWKD